ncbi:hypothetical protein B0H16DRAFT_1466029 [Mycena metata]|uniref:Uncharacterized protein n=1 Tax=Mycena metata TaxID=1033252 RepID=A0AAD7MZV5_9AGAR|nr:hypothetical protein B0H16DRAFT_1466029 [Mycena metata]
MYPECYPESRWVSILIIINYPTPMYATYCGMQTVLATNTLNTVNQNNLKATKSCEYSANVWDTGGNLRVLELKLDGIQRAGGNHPFNAEAEEVVDAVREE